MKKIILACVVSVFFVGVSISQTTAEPAKLTAASIEGTYQIQVVNSRNQPYIPANLNQLVLDNRDATEVKYVTLGTEVRLKVLPLSEINKPDFKPLQKIAHVRN